MKQIILIGCILVFSLQLLLIADASSATEVITMDISGTIDQSTVEAVKECLREAEDRNAEAIILLLDTPGGGLSETFTIVDYIQNSRIPIVGYVYPQGSAAWSAGTLILISSHIAAMANHTIIGSCQPVEITFSGAQPVNDSKTINALVEWIKERAHMYNRNATAAALFITENLNINASEAYKLGVIEVVAPNIYSLLNYLDGRIVQTTSGEVTLHTKNATITLFTPSISTQLLKLVSNPLLTSLLFMLGVFAVIFGISAPGHGAEVFGVIAILLSLLGSGFNVSEISMVFIVIGAILLLIEILVIPGFGVVGIGGIICLILGSIFLIPTYHPPHEWIISATWINNLLILVLVATILIAGFFLFLLYKVLE
ncbi:MAG TPA: nodulation protein NfeD, partial [Thermoplasmatales archaeon]|nr:nodulation protein NfeD [Thermoplasmatales archaeon]